jgi:hypothetical protein
VPEKQRGAGARGQLPDHGDQLALRGGVEPFVDAGLGGIVELPGHELPGPPGPCGRRAHHHADLTDVLGQPPAGEHRLPAAAVGERPVVVGHPVRPRGLGVPQHDQPALHHSSLAARPAVWIPIDGCRIVACEWPEAQWRRPRFRDRRH